MEVDVKFSHQSDYSQPSLSTQIATQKLPQVLFSGNDGDDDYNGMNVYYGARHTLNDDDDASSDVSSIPGASHPVLKSTATGVLRSKDYADQLQLILEHHQHGASNTADDAETHAHSVLTEIASIMKKLDQDKHMIKEDLERERSQVQRLQKRLDDFVEKRLKELPFAVQREHEACSVDIVELQWHVAFKRRQETRIKAKLQLAQTLNEKLKTELTYVQDTDPKLSQKLQLENQVIVNLLQAHNTTATELMKTLKDQEKSEQDSDKAEAKADKERVYLKKEIDGVKKMLQKARDDLSEAEKLHARYIKNIEDTKSAISDTVEAVDEQIEKLERIKEIEKMQEAKVRDLEEKLEEAQKDNRQLTAERDSTLKESEDAQNKREQEKATLEAYIVNNERRQRQLKTESRDIRFENQDLENQIQENKIARDADSKNMERLYKEIEKTEAERDKIRDLFFELDLNNKTLTQKHAEIEEKSKEREQILDEQVESLNAQVRDEVSKRGQIQTNINAEKNNLVNLELDLKKQEERMEKKAEEVEAAVNKVTGQVEKMREKNEVRQKQLQTLKDALEELQKKHHEMETKLTDKKSKLKPKLEKLKAEDLEVSKQLDQMEYATEKLTGELREMKLGSIHLNKVMRNTKNSIEDLTVELAETSIKITEKKRIIKGLEQSLADMSDRLKESKDDFKSLHKDRKNFHIRMQIELENRVTENENLADEYYALKQQLFAMKTDYNSVYQQQVEFEQVLRCLRQVEFLQERFIRNLKEFFKYRNLFYCAEIEDIKREQNIAEDKLQEVRVEMELALGKMSKFLAGMMQGSIIDELKHEELEKIESKENSDLATIDEGNEDESIKDGGTIFITQADAFSTPQTLSHFKILPPINNGLKNDEQAMPVC
ncbi:coiled-coil domain-containing protein 178-like [Symsagittifera roscoffensis]|uniref:coiled-coil domain-containing protein 178-like n=1 Tax=Symsagittifera roscoffensis TaxID=84072 RepID=UPI00307C1455